MLIYAAMFVILVACAVQRLLSGEILLAIGFACAAACIGAQIVRMRRHPRGE